jgi:hypothetical protein
LENHQYQEPSAVIIINQIPHMVLIYHTTVATILVALVDSSQTPCSQN